MKTIEGEQIKEIFNVPANESKVFDFDINSTEDIFLFDIQVKQLPNRVDDIQIYILDDESWNNYKKYYTAIKRGVSTVNLTWNTFLSSRIRWGPIFFKNNKIGRYHLVLDNTHSTITPKTITISGSLSTKPIEKRPKSTAEPLEQFTFPDVHEKIRKVSLKLFQNGHYSQAIFEACKMLETELKKKSKIRRIGEKLATEALNETDPIIKLNKNNTDEEIDEQRGFRFLFMGTFVGIRNPKAHANEDLKDRTKATEYLSLISLLLRRLDEAKVRKKKLN